MKIGGIVTEYNPFHKGHAYQIRKIRELYGDDIGIVCVMSGDFVQRGEPAVFSKYARAESAVRCGADLVIELPISYSVASAERFASGAVNILGRLGVVDYLFFGSETADSFAIEKTAELLLTPAFHEKVKEILEKGCSYPVARSEALRELNDGVDLTINPNDTLGVEYVKAIKRYGFHMTPVAIKREGAMHDRLYDGEMKSGSELRGLMRNDEEIIHYVPNEAFEIYDREMKRGCGPVSSEQLEIAMLSRLRMLPFSVFDELPDSAEGLENKLYAACRTRTSLNGIYDAVKSKRYTHARIRRMVMNAVLGITKQDYKEDNLYARILALNEKGGRILRESDKLRSIHVISKPAMARMIPAEQLGQFEKTADAHDLYVMAYENETMRAGEKDWLSSPIFVK